ncbi:MAG: hypothetical protein WBN92_06530 [Terriglobia bacterium]
MQASELENKLARYLLGELSEGERIEIEDRYLSDGEFFDEMSVAEDELIDTYVRGRLSGKDRELFEQNFLCSAARRERLKSAQALMRFADTHGAVTHVSSWQRFLSILRIESPPIRLVLATGFMLLIIGGPVVVIQMNRLRSDLKELHSDQVARNQREKELEQVLGQQRQQNEALSKGLDQERNERGHLEQELARLTEQQAPPVTFGLGFGERERSSGSLSTQAARVTVPRDAELIKLQLDLLKDDYKDYLVILEDEQHHDVWRGFVQSTKAGRGRAVVVRLPSHVFTAGEYRLALSGTNNKSDYEIISEFSFDVIKK